MAENFDDIQRIKNKRSGFMNQVKEVKNVPKPVAKPEKVLVETITTEPNNPVAAEAKSSEPKKEVTLKKGFIVGYTEEGIVKLEPFGGLGELELSGLVQYSEAKSRDMMNKIARTSESEITPIKEGVVILAQSIKDLLTSKGTAPAS